MKKLLLFALTNLALTGFSQETGTWRIGVQWGVQNNRSQFAGGMSDANARFHQNKFDARAFNIEVRYDLNEHWMGTFGLGVNTFGFDYALAQNYSLYNPKSHFTGIRSSFGALELPLMIFYKFKPNCRNAKWLIGGGFSHNLLGAQTITRSYQTAADGTSPGYLNSVSSTNGGNYTMIRLAVGREKVFKKGGILNASLVLNAGLKQLAKSTVNYTVDGVAYTHDFKTNGSFAGIRLTYFFRPFKTKSFAKTAKH